MSSRGRRKATGRRARLASGPWKSSAGEPTVVTILEDSIRGTIDLAAQDSFKSLHANSVAEALQAVHSTSARALLLSPVALRRVSISEIALLLAKCPGVTPIAVVSRDSGPINHALMELAACGVHDLLDLDHRSGFERLHAIVETGSGEATVKIVDTLLSALGDSTEGTRRFFLILAQSAQDITTVRNLSGILRIGSSTLASRFLRQGLPSPKGYLAAIRLTYVAAYFETSKASIGDVAYRLRYSSPQSLGRHIRVTLGISAGEFRRTFTLESALDHLVSRLITPYRTELLRFDPFDLRRDARSTADLLGEDERL
jgi:AraC-like DNA-binding protein